MDPTERSRLEADLAKSNVIPVGQPYQVADDDAPAINGRHRGWHEANERRLQMLGHIAQGLSIEEACDRVGISPLTYKSYRRRFPKWKARVDEVRQSARMGKATTWNGTPSDFVARYLGMRMSWFQLLIMEELAKIPLGYILLVLIPPEHGKTTTFENYANMKLAQVPGWRFLVTGENRDLASKILLRVRNRMDPLGPTPQYVEDFGPFVPQTGESGRLVQPWGDFRFRVYQARHLDERNFSMEAVGANGTIVSARTDHLHIDDPQSTKTLTQTDKRELWIRQDAWSRPAGQGVTSMMGTRVGEDDVWERFLNDEDLDPIMKVIRLPAIITNQETGEQEPLWQGHHTFETLEVEKIKAGQEAWDRNWMQDPGMSTKGKGTFTKEATSRCLDAEISLLHHVGEQSDPDDGRPIVYIGLDPALGGKNVVMAWEIHPARKMILRKVREREGLQRNEQIMAELEAVVRWVELSGDVTDVVIEDKNFQLGLVNDERLQELADKYGFQIRGHQTGWDKYDPDIGVASMATSFRKQEIVLPWADDDETRRVVGIFLAQLHKWRPGVKGKNLRQDQVMATWFVWMLWRSRWKDATATKRDTGSWQREALPWTPTEAGLLVPAGYR